MKSIKRLEKLSHQDKLNQINIHNNLEGSNWGLDYIGINEAHKKTKGEGIKILLVDTGVDNDHPDLKNSFSQGYNFFERSFDVTDLSGHGTHVAGILAGKHTGVAPMAELGVIKSLDGEGYGSYGSVMDGITYAIGNNYDVVCMSLGIDGDLPISMHQRFREAYERNIAIVCATGNNGLRKPFNPAGIEEVIGVGGHDKDGNISSFSNRGHDILAPSVDILSTYKDGKYAMMSGTSMASPFVAGAVALILSYNKSRGVRMSVDQIKQMLSKGEMLNLTEYLK